MPDHIVTRDNGKFDSFDRLLKHLNSFASCLEPHQKSIMLICFMYDHPGMKPRQERPATQKITRMIKKCTSMEMWQLNLKFTPRGIKLIRFFSLD